MILAYDGRHLARIERGGPFTDLSHRRGAAEINEITRPRADWQRTVLSQSCAPSPVGL